MITIVTINAKKDGVHSFFDNIARGTGVNIKHIINISDLDVPPEKVIIFHSEQDNPPDWMKLEDFDNFDFPEEDFYYVFGSDSGNVPNDIKRTCPQYCNSRFISIHRLEGFKVYFAHCTAIIVLWERFKLLNP